MKPTASLVLTFPGPSAAEAETMASGGKASGGEASDAELVARAETDAAARAALYRRHASSVASLALRLVRDRDEAKDVLQDTFLRAFEILGQLEDPSRVGAWLRSIAVRQAQRRIRRGRRRRALGIGRAPETIPLEELAGRDIDPSARLQLRRVDAVLQQLPDRARLAWTLRLIEGETLEDIAALLSVSLATVKRDLKAARDRVRAAVDGVDGQGGGVR